MIGHLGARVSALLDGQLPAEEAERAWQHVHACWSCYARVEREGWVKTRLAVLSQAESSAPHDLKGSLLGAPPEPSRWTPACARNGGVALRRHQAVAVLGGGALSAAVLGVLALSATPGQAPLDRRAPVTQVSNRTQGPSATPTSALLGSTPSPAPTVRSVVLVTRPSPTP